jgi:hypothetical protein
MASIWTHGVWVVKAGHEDQFVEAWRAMAGGAVAKFDPPGRPDVMRDRERPNVFRSFGGWDAGTVARFREFMKPHLEGIRELTESIDIFALDEVPLDG